VRPFTKAAAAFVGVAVAASLTPVAYAGESRGTLRFTNVAHRGASSYAPENTLASIRKGITLGADQIELDVQRTKDGKLVIIHDTSLARTTDVEQVFPDRAPWKVIDFTYAEVRRLDAGSWKAPEYADERVPTLGEAIGVIRKSHSGMLLEIKAPELYRGIEAEVAAQMRAFPGYVRSAVGAGRLAVQSFNFDSMRTYKGLEPTVPVGLLGTPTLAQLPELATWADQINPHHLSVDAAYVAEVHRLGMDCLVWTVDGAPAMNRAIDLGVDGVITNQTDVLRQVLRGRSHSWARPAA
jgi:glycerophosphoryl diester phosphodiesterase